MNGNETNFDLDVLRTFVEGVRHQSLARAAELRRKSPSTVSLQIQRLEQQVGVKLFQRIGRGVRPTEEAYALLRFAEAMVAANDEALRLINPGKVLEKIRVGVPADLAENWLPPILAGFLRAHPDTIIETQVMRNTEIIEKVDRGDIDVALHWDRSDAISRGHVVVELPIQWMAAESFSSDPERSLPLVVLQSPCLFRDLGLQELEKTVSSRIAMASTSVTGLWAAVAAGLGITCRVPVGVPGGVRRFEHPALPNLGMIGISSRTSALASATGHLLRAEFEEKLSELASNSHLA